VIEQQPIEGEKLAGAPADLIPEADVIAITGTALINRSREGLLALCRPGTFVMILGPITPPSPVLIGDGVAMLSGGWVVDEVAALRTICRGPLPTGGGVICRNRQREDGVIIESPMGPIDLVRSPRSQQAGTSDPAIPVRGIVRRLKVPGV